MRIYSLDLMKIVAIFLVILSHISLYFMIRDPQDFGVLFIRQTGQFGVAMFYMASGYFLLNNRHEDQFPYVMNKSKAIAIALIFWLCFYYLYDTVVLTRVLDAPHYDFWSYLNTDRTASEARHLWFLFSIIGLYFVVPLLRPVFIDANRQMLIYVIAALFLLANLTLVEKTMNSLFGIASFIHPALLMSSQVFGLISFLIGGYFGLTYQHTTLSVRQYFSGIALALLSFCVLTMLTQQWGIVFFYRKFYNLPLQISAVCLFYLMLHTRFTWLEGMISRVGSKTLGIYLVHNIFVIEINNTPTL
ncbi:MAG: acyltransferase [Symbiopectobacterium sp.]|uniref:acyltransferase n=1 Tax=Symbiopectobacterium sp. TaxID=2952789 RepID=UPI0039EC4CED